MIMVSMETYSPAFSPMRFVRVPEQLFDAPKQPYHGTCQRRLC